MQRVGIFSRVMIYLTKEILYDIGYKSNQKEV